MNFVRNGFIELKNGKTRRNIGVICVATTPIANARLCANELSTQCNDFVDFTIEKHSTSLETILNLTTWKTHATSSVHKALMKVVHNNNGDEE